MNTATVDKIKAALRAFQPAFVRMYVADGEPRDIGVGGARNKWGPIVAALDEYPWTTIELYDGKKRMLGAPVKNDGAAGEMEPLTMPAGAAGSRMSDLAVAFQVTGRHSERMIELNNETMKPAWDAMGKTLGHALTLNETLQEELATTRKALRAAEAQVTELGNVVQGMAKAKDTGDESGFADILKNAAKVLPHVAPFLRMLMPGKSAPAAAAAAAGPRAVP